jgi:hypothetical protein
MKTTKSIAVFFLTQFTLYFLLSAVGCLFVKSDSSHYTYLECLGSVSWFIVYNFFIGWIISLAVAQDYYDSH